MSITLLELRTKSRQKADMESNNFISDSEANSYINFAIAELHDLLIESYGSDYFLSSSTFNTVANTETYALPATFYKLRGLDIKQNANEWTNVRPFNFNERNVKSDFGAWNGTAITNIRYRIMGGNIRLTPVPDSAQQMRIWFIPKATVLSSDNSTLDDINQYSDYIITSAAINMLNKEESDTRVLVAEKDRLTQRIMASSQNRDASEPSSISDIHAESYFYR